MKKTFLAVFAALALIGCQEQSELNFADITGSATVKGKVLYEVGYVVEGENLISTTAPAAGIEVVAQISYSQYDAGAVGVKQIKATTNEQGEYELIIPVGQTSIALKVVPASFEGEYKGNLNANLEVLPTTAFFTHNGLTTNVLDGQILVLADMTMTPDVEAAIETRNTEVTITGKVKTQWEETTKDSSGDVDGVKQGTAPAETRVDIKIAPAYISDTREIIYRNVKLNEEGVYTLKAKLYDVWNLGTLVVSVTAQPYTTTSFAHYYYLIDDMEWKKQSIAGLFSTAFMSAGLTEDALLVPTKVSDIVMIFKPTQPEIIRGIGNYDVDYDKEGNRLYSYSNPYGWIY